jgi:hypothetical protein
MTKKMIMVGRCGMCSYLERHNEMMENGFGVFTKISAGQCYDRKSFEDMQAALPCQFFKKITPKKHVLSRSNTKIRWTL